MLVVVCSPFSGLPSNYASFCIDRSKPLTPKDFAFEAASDSSNSPATQPSIIVDSSTVEFLKSRLSDFEKRLKASESNLANKTEEVAKLNPSM